MAPKRFLLFGTIILIISCMATAPPAAADTSYNYITSADLKARIQSGASITILDIQVEKEYSLHHIKGAVATYAYPVNSDEEKNRIDSVYPSLAGSFDPVVIVCPRGGGGAKRTFDYLINKGFEADRLFILEKGQAGWPYPELLEGKGL
jgi:thiosulfate/3-mercaptopyruvate sulfurtransferase